VPFCSLGGLYYIRAQPGVPSGRPWTEESERQLNQQIAEFAQIRTRDEGRIKTVEDAIDKEESRALRREADIAAASAVRLAEEERRLVALEMEFFAEAERKAAEVEEQAELERCSVMEAAFREVREKLEGEVAASRSQAAEYVAAAAACRESSEAAEAEAQVLRESLAKLTAEMAVQNGVEEHADGQKVV